MGSCGRPSGPSARPERHEPNGPALRDEIVAMAAEDQKLRMALLADDSPDMKLVHELEAVDKKNTARMKQIVAEYGWPGRSLVGSEASMKAWLLVQHASDDLEFQRVCLERMKPLVDLGEVEPQDYCYLFDRIRVFQGRPQRYGTQFLTKDGRTEPFAIEDPEELDERRKAMGLEPFEEYRKMLMDQEGG